MMKFMMINIPFGPTILKTFNMNVFPEKPIKFFYDVVLQTINSRKEAKSRRNDLVDMMIDAVKGELDQVWLLNELYFFGSTIKDHCKNTESRFSSVILESRITDKNLMVVPGTYKPSAPYLTMSVYLCSSRRNAQGKVERP